VIRVIQWATGSVGRHALEAILAQPGLELVGARVYSAEKAGRWRVHVEGAPSMSLEATIAMNGEDENDQGCLGTAMHAVHAIPHVCAAAPGIRTFLDLPMITGRGALDLRRGPAA
jgi:hypothetical protein